MSRVTFTCLERHTRPLSLTVYYNRNLMNICIALYTDHAIKYNFTKISAQRIYLQENICES